jgi:hypothetical protein
VHGSGYLLAHSAFRLAHLEHNGTELMVLSIPFRVIRDAHGAVFIGHVAGWGRDNPMLAERVELDVGAVGEAVRIGCLIAGLPVTGFPYGGMYE